MKNRWEQVGTISEVGREAGTARGRTRVIKRERRRKGDSMGESLVKSLRKVSPILQAYYREVEATIILFNLV